MVHIYLLTLPIFAASLDASLKVQILWLVPLLHVLKLLDGCQRLSLQWVSYVLCEASALKDLHAALGGAVVVRDTASRVVADLVVVPVAKLALSVFIDEADWLNKQVNEELSKQFHQTFFVEDFELILVQKDLVY